MNETPLFEEAYKPNLERYLSNYLHFGYRGEHQQRSDNGVWVCTADREMRRARALLLSHLNEVQKADFLETGLFVERSPNHIYYILGDYSCFAYPCPPTTMIEPTVICIRPQTWTPNDDVTLGHKMLVATNEQQLWYHLLSQGHRYQDAFTAAARFYAEHGAIEASIKGQFSRIWSEDIKRTHPVRCNAAHQ